MYPFKELWNKRELIIHFSKMNVKLRYRSTYLGFLWAALEPLFIFFFLYMVFTSIREVPIETFPIYLITGVMMYTIFSKGTTSGLTSLFQNATILKSLNIRKEIFPLITTGSTSILLFVNVGVFFALMPLFNFTPSITIILLPFLLLLLLFLILGISYLLSILFIFAKDIQPIWGVFVYAMMFVSPIFWYTDNVDGILLQIHSINPLGQLIEIGHKIVFGEFPSLEEWGYSTLLVSIVLIVGYSVFQKYEKRVTEEL
tara:strand:- start:458 stop:1228 length:771 start_codon:yes stop_codon:yes gene_type:complete